MADELYRRLSCGGCRMDFCAPRRTGRPPARCGGCKSVPKPTAVCLGCAAELVRKSQHGRPPTKYCPSCRAKRASYREAFHCTHPKPTLENGRVRKTCFECVPKPEPKPRKPYALKSIVVARCALPLCGAEFDRVGPNQRYCGGECRAAADVARLRLKLEEARDRSPRACRQCGESFAPAYGDRREVFCGRDCRVKYSYFLKSGHTHVRRAKKFGCAYDVALDKWEVFERDGWKCQMCGCDTPKHLSGTKHPNAPELDHMVALKLGGSHTADNVCCLCQTCNGIKGDLPLDVAIDLIAKKMEMGYGARRI